MLLQPPLHSLYRIGKFITCFKASVRLSHLQLDLIMDYQIRERMETLFNIQQFPVIPEKKKVSQG